MNNCEEHSGTHVRQQVKNRLSCSISQLSWKARQIDPVIIGYIQRHKSKIKKKLFDVSTEKMHMLLVKKNRNAKQTLERYLFVLIFSLLSVYFFWHVLKNYHRNNNNSIATSFLLSMWCSLREQNWMDFYFDTYFVTFVILTWLRKWVFDSSHPILKFTTKCLATEMFT